jgi:hypothetical protein
LVSLCFRWVSYLADLNLLLEKDYAVVVVVYIGVKTSMICSVLLYYFYSIFKASYVLFTDS